MLTIDVHAHLPCSKNLNPAEAAQTLAFSESMGVSVEEDYPAARLLSEMDQGGVQTVVLQGHPPNAGLGWPRSRRRISRRPWAATRDGC